MRNRQHRVTRPVTYTVNERRSIQSMKFMSSASPRSAKPWLEEGLATLCGTESAQPRVLQKILTYLRVQDSPSSGDM